MRGDHQVVVARLDRDVADGDRWKISALVPRPLATTIEGNPQSELGADEEEIGIYQILPDDVSIATHRAAGADERLPRLPIIGRLVGVWAHVAKAVQIERREDSSGIEVTGIDVRHPRRLRQTSDVADDIGPRFPAVTRELQIPVVGARPNYVRIPGRFRDRVDRRVHLGRGVVDSHTARLLLQLFGWIVGGEIRRDAIPRLTEVARAEEILRADVHRPVARRTDVNGSVPVEAQFLLLVARQRPDPARFMSLPVDTTDLAALRLGVDVIL